MPTAAGITIAVMGRTAPERNQRAKMVVVINPSEGKRSMGRSIRNFAAATRVGLDLAKNAFQVHAVDANGEVVAARKLRRGQLVASLPSCRVAWSRWRPVHRPITGLAS